MVPNRESNTVYVNAFTYPTLKKRYVDDIFTIAHEDKVEEMLEVLMKAHRNFTFTIEVENNGDLPFLDLRIIREEKRISFDIYRKPTYT